jgi:flavin-dependent dehydrogenase
MHAARHSPEVVVIGGGPAGSAIARLLALRGHSVMVLARPVHREQGLAESLPPSSRKVLAAVGALEFLESSETFRNTGNVVWWGGTEERVEQFGDGQGVRGYQVWRPDFDRLVARLATEAGAIWREGVVRGAQFTEDRRASVTFEPAAGPAERIDARFVVDASGRAGVVARRFRRQVIPCRTHAWIGLWATDPDECGGGDARTLVETCEDGWAWSVPVSPARRCVTVMVDPDLTPRSGAGPFASRYRAQLEKTHHLRRLVDGARLERAWGCDASLYDSAEVGGSQFLLVGDAASAIDPLSSFGIKKALTSAWMGAAVVHTSLTEPALALEARRLFADHERDVQASSVRRSAGYAREAALHHPTPFWMTRAETPATLALDEADPIEGGEDVAAAFAELRRSPGIELQPGRSLRFELKPEIRGDRIALERAVVSERLARPVRFIDNVDLTRLVEMAAQYRHVGELFDGYCRAAAPVPLPNFLKALSVLVARQLLEPAQGRS